MGSRSRARRSPATSCRRAASWPSPPDGALRRWKAQPPANRPSDWPPGGSPTSAPNRPARPDTRWSMRSACWAPTLRSWPGGTRMSCFRARMPRRCWIWRPSNSPKWSRIWCPNSFRSRWSSACCRICCASESPSATPVRFWRPSARRLRSEQPKVVEDLVPKQLPLSVVQRVLQNLLRERVSIRDTGSILEALGEAALSTRNLVLLTEYARQAVRRTVAKRYLDASGNLPAYFLDASIEQAVESAMQHAEQNSHLSMPPQTIREILDRIQRKVGSPEGPVAAVTTAGARYFLRQMVEPTLPNLFFLSHNEIPAGVKVVSLGVVQ